MIKRLAGAVLAALVSMVSSTVAAQDEIIVDGQVMTYQYWLHGPPDSRRYPSRWDDTGRNNADWLAAIEHWWSVNAGVPATIPAAAWQFVTIGDGNQTEPFELRWIAECIAAGDVVIPFWSGERRGTIRVPVLPGEPRDLIFAVFAPGAPADGIEPIMRYEMRQQLVAEDEIERVIASFRATLPPQAP